MNNAPFGNEMMKESNHEQAGAQVVTSIAPVTSQQMEKPAEKLTLAAVQRPDGRGVSAAGRGVD
jgi:hypothetical protein